VLIGVVALVVLVAMLAIHRRRGPPRLDVWESRPSTPVVLGGAALVVLANAPLALVVPWISGLPALLPGDAGTHARVARAIATDGLRHGWVDAYQGGFPLGPHYPSVGVGLAALLIEAGVSPAAATHLLAVTAILAVPLLAWWTALQLGARPYAALVGALYLSWMSPSNPFTGGYEAFYVQGLLSQVVALPAIMLTVAGIVGTGPVWTVAVPAAIAVVAHPQLTTACLVALSLPLMSTFDRRVMGRYVRAGVVVAVAGAAVYGPGIATLHVPFGWPTMAAWKVTGFGPNHLSWWFADGDLMDSSRGPVLTTIWGAALVVLLARAGRAPARAALLASAWAVTLAVSGEMLKAAGRLGPFLLTFLQPLRMVGLLPLVAAATVVVALEESRPFATLLTQRLRSAAPWLARASAAASLLLFGGLALPARFEWAAKIHVLHKGHAGASPCGAATPPGYDAEAVRAWLGALHNGRLWYDDASPTGRACAFGSGLELATQVPIGGTSGVGAHVGVHTVAFHELHPERPGAARRAEALGVRSLLLLTGPAAGDGWAMVAQRGSTGLARRQGGTDTIGVGCVTRAWRGSEEALRQRLFKDLVTPDGADRLLDPTALIALEHGTGEVTEREMPDTGCSADGATVIESPREAGAFEAEVVSSAPVDVVFRAASFPSWHVSVDGRPAETQTVAPGFFATRVAPGRHRVLAVVTTLPHYLQGIFLACAVVAMAGSGRAARMARTVARRLRLRALERGVRQ
jgi:hypothetical protein